MPETIHLQLLLATFAGWSVASSLPCSTTTIGGQLEMGDVDPIFGHYVGRLQVASGVTHLVADSLWVPNIATPPRRKKSRDFH